jgi:hypothetical protein
MKQWTFRILHLAGALAFLIFGLVPTADCLTVVYARGPQAFSSGVRVAPIKPPRFTDGQPVPSSAAVKAIFTAAALLITYMILPILLLPAAFFESRVNISPSAKAGN